jgi:hypothetical protein
MLADSKRTTVRCLDRLHLRLGGDSFAAIEAANAATHGNAPRNTWIVEAVEEISTRERGALVLRGGDRFAHG